jgi:hypothetical protein
LASPILRDTIKKLKARRAELQRQIKGPLNELAQIEKDLEALGATPSRNGARAPRGAHQAAVLRAIRNGATTPEAIAEKTRLAPAAVGRTVNGSLAKQKLVTEGMNGLTLTKAGRERLAKLEGR